MARIPTAGAAMDDADAAFAHEFLGGTCAVAFEDRIEFAAEQQTGALDFRNQSAKFSLQGVELVECFPAHVADVRANFRSQ